MFVFRNMMRRIRAIFAQRLRSDELVELTNSAVLSLVFVPDDFGRCLDLVVKVKVLPKLREQMDLICNL